MSTIEEIRHKRLLQLIEEANGLTPIAKALGLANTSTISQYKNRTPDSRTGKPKGIGSPFARRLEKVCKKPQGWMDTLDEEVQEEQAVYRVAEPAASYDLPPLALADWVRLPMNESIYNDLPEDGKEWVKTGVRQVLLEAKLKYSKEK